MRPGLAVLALTLIAPAVARAEVVIDGLRELRCERKVHLDGTLATVTEVHDFEASPQLQRYDFLLPPGATVTEATLERRGQATVTVPVLAEALDGPGTDAEALGLPADPGALRWRGAGADGEDFTLALARAGGPLRVRITWVAAATYDGGHVRLAIPPRGAGPLVACAVRVTTGASREVARYGPAFVDGQAAGRRPITVDNQRTTAIEAELIWRRPGPVVLTRSLPVGDRAITAIGIYQPPRATPRPPPQRLLLAVDLSRSMTPEGRVAAAHIADRLVASLPGTTPVQLIGFDRRAATLLPQWTPAAAARPAVRSALAARAPGAGTDLGAALNLIAATAGADATRVVVITDGLLSPQVGSADLLGAAMMPAQTTTLDVVIPVVPGAALPDRALLQPLTDVFHGQVLAIRTAGPAIDRVAAHLAEDPPLRDLTVSLDGELVTLDLPTELRPGTGVLAITTGSGPASPAVEVAGLRGGVEVRTSARSLPAGVDALLVAAAGRIILDGGPLERAAAIAAGRRQRAVSPLVAFAFLDRAAPGAAARLELAATTGVYQAIGAHADLDSVAPPPAEDDAVVGEPADLPASTYQYLIKYHLWPAVKTCYRDALRGRPRFSGTLEVTLEIVRGEVTAARFGGSPLPSGFVDCVADAAYAIDVPMPHLAGHGETIAIVRKPIYLRVPDDDADPVLSEEYGFAPQEAGPPPL